MKWSVFLVQLFFLCNFFVTVPLYSRTVHTYKIHKPGETAPINGEHQKFNQRSYLKTMDEDVLAQEQFKLIKMRELEGREPYRENRKTSITRTF